MLISIRNRMEENLMGMIPEVKCRRCGATFSALRSRCPNCGTRRVTQSGRTPGTTPGTVKGTASYERAETNTKWQMIFGLILVVAVILAVIVMVTTSLSSPDGSSNHKATPPPMDTGTPVIEAPPTPTPTPTPTVESIDITFGNKKVNAGEKSWPQQTVGETIKYQAQAYPMGLSGLEYKWSTDNEEVFKLTPEENGLYCTVECIGFINGGAKITVECCGVKTDFRIYTAKAA